MATGLWFTQIILIVYLKVILLRVDKMVMVNTLKIQMLKPGNRIDGLNSLGGRNLKE